MGESELLEGTLEPVQRRASGAPRQTWITLLHHPDLRRIGEVAGPIAARQALSRLEPRFGAPGHGGAPLGDRHLSRTPLWLSDDGEGGLVLSPESGGAAVQADGVPVKAPLRLSPERLARGVILELAGRVLALVHTRAPFRPSAAARELIGESEALADLRDAIARVADLDTPVLLRGETGTGKELVARGIHESGPRGRGPFVAVNMAAIPPSTAASELFGHRRGAFTGALRDHRGVFEQASGGTLLLDEIGAAPPELQAMLLRALETGLIRPVGGDEDVRVDVRVVAATDEDLEAAVAEGAFRAPLLHRLASYSIHLPPLRERREDLGRLVCHFLRLELAPLGEAHLLERPGAEEPWLPAQVMLAFARHGWPGNVRQLRNAVRQLVISSRGSSVARLDPALQAMLAAAPPGPAPAPAAAAEERALAPRPRRAPSEIDDDLLLETMRRVGWKPTRAAAELGISKTSLYALMERCPRIRKAKDVSRDELAGALEACGGDLDAAAARLEVSRRGLQLRLRDLDMGRD